MRYRALSSDFDYTFGQGQANFYRDNVEAVAQAILTRLRLLVGEWFLDLNEGLPLYTKIIGRGTYNTYDPAIRRRILGTQGVLSIVRQSSSVDPNTRHLSVQSIVSTIYGVITLRFGVDLSTSTPFLTTESGFYITTEDGALLTIPVEA